jgi:hypothetical protein
MKPGKLAKAAAYYRRQGAHEQAHFYETILVEQGRCRRCGRLLTDPASVERGVGPECALRYGKSSADMSAEPDA